MNYEQLKNLAYLKEQKNAFHSVKSIIIAANIDHF